MRILVVASLLLAGCASVVWLYPTRYDVRSDEAAWTELAQTDATPPAPFEQRQCWVDGVDVNAVSLTPVSPGAPTMRLAVGDATVVTEHGTRISRDELQPGDEVRVSFSNRAGTMPDAVTIERIARAPK